tara:strand:- start:104 stop:1957 length:1854 start_codon:yes stop_codon:yes gene_type:complete
MTDVKRDIKYLNRDFSELRSRLIEYSKTYFPNTYSDFSPTSPGMLFIEQAAYVGDVLGFYLDNQIQENFITYARQTNNIYELAYMMGYKPKVSGASQVSLTISQQIPTKDQSGITTPDYTYTLNVPSNTVVSNPNGTNFLIQDDIDFSVSSSNDLTDINLSTISGNSPEYYTLSKSVKAISATISTQTFTFGSPSPFQTIEINSDNILGILDVKDSDGNIWYEVDYLGQELIYDSIKNTNQNDPNNNANAGEVPYLLKIKKAQRRFATRFLDNTTLQIQFGSGTTTDNDEEIIPNPNNVGLGLTFEQSKLTTAYSPTNFLYTDTYGISPSNTTLTVRYLTGGGVESNAPAFTLTTISNPDIKFNNSGLDSTLANYIRGTLSSTNPESSTGGSSGDSLEEIRQKSMMSFSSQNRAVTADDYLVRSLSMPPKYGVISKAYIEKPTLTDNQVSTIDTLNLYCLSKNISNQLSIANTTLKQNLRTYLSQNRIIGDNIEIKDAYIINISVMFEIIVLPEYNNNEVLTNCINGLKDYFNIDKWQINQPILLRDIYINLDKVKGVQTVKNVKISNKTGSNSDYSKYGYDIEGATQNQVIYPSLDPSIFEVKYLNQDITGKVVPL